MTIPHHLSNSRLVEEVGAENKFNHVYGSSVRVVQEKFMYNLKDASFEVRNKRRKSAFGSDSLILNPRDLRHNHRYVLYLKDILLKLGHLSSSNNSV